MNILFISFDADPPHMGGTATVVNVIAREFQNRGHEVFLGFYTKSEHPSVFFSKKVNLASETEIKSFVERYSIDVIYNTQAIGTNWNILKEYFPNAKIVSAYHNKPLLRYFHLESLLNIFYESNNAFYKFYTLCKIPLLPFWKLRSQRREQIEFQKMYANSDKIQLLSEKFYPNFLKILPDASIKKLVAIGNPIVYNALYPQNKLCDKEKKVIVVCSTNYQKRAYLMIKIWACIEKDARFNDWTFDFVGGGEGFGRILELSRRLKLQRINFVGYQQPLDYYYKGSIFMMTSRYEGWPMVLMEAMQMGVVPVVYNSFESLSDIVTEGFNGFVVQNNKQNIFVEKMKRLMLDDTLRQEMAEHAMESCQRYTIEKIVNRYESLFNDLIKNE